MRQKTSKTVADEDVTTVKINKETVSASKPATKAVLDKSGIVYDENPFMEDLVRSLTTKKKQLTVARGSEVTIKDSEANIEVLGQTRIYQEVEVDRKSVV